MTKIVVALALGATLLFSARGDRECGAILANATAKPQTPLSDWAYGTNAGKTGDLVIYQNGYGKYFLETADRKSLLELQSKIEIKERNNKTYIFADFTPSIFTKPTIYEYENNAISAVCAYGYDADIKCDNCADRKLEQYITQAESPFAKDNNNLDIDIDNNGKKEAIKYIDNLSGGRCDYESYILADTNEDITAYLSRRYGADINKCAKSVKIFSYENKNYIYVKDLNLNAKVYLIDGENIKEYSFTPANISLSIKR
ncbi:MAG: hypothetical protein LBC09_00525 [Helicobacteraceae bacterium]|jgi:hypothetical protein|nr:hypothetical protein [Helicobacteraceae bacterium]